MALRTLFLDRDGVINHDSPDYIKSAAEWQPLPGALEAIATLSQQGVWIGIATNQSGLARGLFTSADLDQMHLKMRQGVEALGGRIDAIAHCFHLPDNGRRCRKPEPGLLEQLIRQRGEGFVSHETLMIGDSYKDLQAAQAVGIPAVLVRTGKGANTERDHAPTVPVYDSLGHWAELNV